jgi:hypothetical protein
VYKRQERLELCIVALGGAVQHPSIVKKFKVRHTLETQPHKNAYAGVVELAQGI